MYRIEPAANIEKLSEKYLDHETLMYKKKTEIQFESTAISESINDKAS